MADDDPRFDGLLLSLAQQKQGIDPLLDTVFSFLRRKTDFFTGADPQRARDTVLRSFERQANLAQRDRATAAPPARDAQREAAARERAELKRRQEADELAAAAAAAAAAEAPRVEELPDDPAEDPPAPPATTEEADAKDDDDDEPPPPGNGGSGPGYVWTQTLQEVTVTIPVPEGTKGRMVDCDIRPTRLRVGLKGQAPVVEAEFHKRVICDDSFWTLEDNRFVVLTLQKQNQMEWWKCVCVGHPEINTSKVQPENSQLSDLDGETRQTVEKMMFDQRAKALGQPTADERQKQEVLDKFMKQHPEMDFSQAKIS